MEPKVREGGREREVNAAPPERNYRRLSSRNIVGFLSAAVMRR